MNEPGADSFEPTRALVKRARAISWDTIPDDAREVARHCILDFLGVAIAGSREPLAGILVREVATGEGSRECALIGRAQRASQLSAALINGAAAHALDFDDTHTAMGGHPSVPVVPAILALAETTGASGRALAEALVAGVEFECRLGTLIGSDHYSIGFHSTGTIGTFGAAAACARLLNLDEEAWMRAIGLAGTQAAGLKSGFGTMAKPLHAGRAASNGLLSAVLARGGFTSNTAIIEAAQGFAATHAGQPITLEDVAALDGRFLIRDTLFKYHASCYLTHAPIQAAASIRAREALDPATIDEVEVRVHRSLLGVCNIQNPATGLEGKFSLRATTAMALLGIDTGSSDSFTDAIVASPEVVRMRERVRILPTGKAPSTRAEVEIKAGAKRLHADADSGRPWPDLAAQRDALTTKFLGLVTPIAGSTAAARIAEAALGADRLSKAAELIAIVNDQCVK